MQRFVPISRGAEGVETGRRKSLLTLQDFSVVIEMRIGLRGPRVKIIFREIAVRRNSNTIHRSLFVRGTSMHAAQK